MQEINLAWTWKSYHPIIFFLFFLSLQLSNFDSKKDVKKSIEGTNCQDHTGDAKNLSGSSSMVLIEDCIHFGMTDIATTEGTET